MTYKLTEATRLSGNLTGDPYFGSPHRLPHTFTFHNAKQSLGITLLSDPNKTVHKAYGAWGKKKNYGKEYEGVIRSTFIISPESKIAESWNKVKVRVKRKDGEVRHVDIVKDRLKDIQRK